MRVSVERPESWRCERRSRTRRKKEVLRADIEAASKDSLKEGTFQQWAGGSDVAGLENSLRRSNEQCWDERAVREAENDDETGQRQRRTVKNDLCIAQEHSFDDSKEKGQRGER
jgi:hypothetical protein